jgi:hypothetical protein
MAAINKSRLSSRTNATLPNSVKNYAHFFPRARFLGQGEKMHLGDKIKEAGAAGYILLWLLGIPIPILLIIFLLRGCT